MRRLLSSLSACWSYTHPVGGGLLPSAPAAFSASLSSYPMVGLGRCQCFAPARFFAGEPTEQLEVQDEL